MRLDVEWPNRAGRWLVLGAVAVSAMVAGRADAQDLLAPVVGRLFPDAGVVAIQAMVESADEPAAQEQSQTDAVREQQGDLDDDGDLEVIATDGTDLTFYCLEGGGLVPDATVPAQSGLQDALIEIGARGHRHHTAVTPGHVAAPVVEAFQKYLGYEVTCV